jgi:hypothetical protein
MTIYGPSIGNPDGIVMPSVEIEIFRPGTHRDMSGREITFTEADLVASATAYDPAAHEAPACVGHPKHDAPAYGWASGLKFADGGLVAVVDQIDPEFAELVRAGRFKKISPAFYEPDSAANPKPGSYYLRHIGFLGAQPPAVKGLKPVAFADGEAGTVAFADWDMLDLVGMLRGFREFIIEKFDAETADRLFPTWTLDRLQNSAAQPEPDADNPAYAERPAERSPELQAEADRLKAESDRLAADRAAFAEERATARRNADTAFLGDLVKQGRLLPAQVSGALAFLESIADAGTVAFGEGAARREEAPRDWFKSFAAGLPRQVAFGEHAPASGPDGKPPHFPVPAGTVVDPDRAELHHRALRYQESHQGVTYIAAVRAVSQE